ncbi:MAG: Stk1 family PASTA domain-containing Ser/Thr kinase [Acidimicrobiales bacterium]
MLLAPGTILGGRYELSHQIARGGMADVYRARDRQLDRPVALKVLFPELSVDRAFVERFRREAQAAANLSHPHIVPVFDWGEDSGVYFIVMEFVDGRPLSAILHSTGALASARAAAIAADVANALGYAHRNGVVHRDVKPGNVLITDEGLVKVTDFGIARAVNTTESLTQTGAVMGTAAYFSPEQAQGHPVDGRSDVYSLGVVLYEMVTGQPPFTGDTPVAVASKHVREFPVPVRERNPVVPVGMEAVIMRALAKSPAERYASADDLQADLVRFQEGAPLAASTATQMVGISPATTALGAVDSRTQALSPSMAAAQHGPTEADEARERRRTGLYVGILGVLVLALAVVSFFLLRSLGFISSSQGTSMPSLVGEPYASAYSTLTADGMKVKEKKVASSDVAGTVVRTSPSSGAPLSSGQTVTLYVSTGSGPSAASVKVPDVRNLSYSTAVETLNAVHLQVGSRSYVSSKSAAAGIVMRQSPGPGASVAANSTINLVISNGPPAPQQVAVPYVRGETPAAAGAKLGQAGFEVGSIVDRASVNVKQGLVIGTSPPAGTPEPSGTAVNLIVSTGPSQSPVPDVVGETQSLAESTLTQAGFTPVVVCQAPPFGSSGTPGYVWKQSPQPGTQGSTGSQVSIYVDPTSSTSTTSTLATTTTTTTSPGSC